MVACREILTEKYKAMGNTEKMDCSLSPSVKEKKRGKRVTFNDTSKSHVYKKRSQLFT